MEHTDLRTLKVDTALQSAVRARAFGRLPIFDATRMIGFSDAELARLLGCPKMTVSNWVLRKRQIPAVKLCALFFLLFALRGVIGKAPEGEHAKRARLIDAAVRDLTMMSVKERWPDKIPADVTDVGIALAEQMLAKLGGGYILR